MGQACAGYRSPYPYPTSGIGVRTRTRIPEIPDLPENFKNSKNIDKIKFAEKIQAQKFNNQHFAVVFCLRK